MKVTLVNPAHTVTPPAPGASIHSGTVPPSSLLSLAAMLPHGLFEVSIIDLNLKIAQGEISWNEGFFESSVKLIQNESPDIVGFTAFGSDYPAVYQIAKLLKNNLNCFVVLGGAQASAIPEASLAYHQIDAVVIGEGEYTFLELCVAIRNKADLSSIPGIAYRRNNVPFRTEPRKLADLDSLPFPALHLINLDQYKEINEFRFYYDVGRGCPYACSFCSTSLTFGRTFRMKSPERIVQELEAFIGDYGIDRFFFTHDLFTTNRKVVIDICDAIQDRGINPRWKCYSRCDTLDSALLHKMKDAGCDAMFFGVESGSKRVQRELNKNLDLHNDLKIVKECSAQLKSVFVGMIAGAPSESPSELEASMRTSLHLKLNWVQRTGLNLLMPLSGTTIARNNIDKLVFPLAKNDYPDFLHEIHDNIANDRKIYTFFYYIPHETQTYRDISFRLNTFNNLILRLFPYAVAFIIERAQVSINDILDSWHRYCVTKGLNESLCPDDFVDFVRNEFPTDQPLQMVAFDVALHKARSNPGVESVYDFNINVHQIAENLRNGQMPVVRERLYQIGIVAEKNTQKVQSYRLTTGKPKRNYNCMDRTPSIIFITFAEGSNGPPEFVHTTDALRIIGSMNEERPRVFWIRCFVQDLSASHGRRCLSDRSTARIIPVEAPTRNFVSTGDATGTDCFQQMLVHINDISRRYALRYIHCFGLEEGTRLGIVAARMHGVPAVVTFNSYQLRRGAEKNAYNLAWCLRNCSCAVASSVQAHKDVGPYSRHAGKDVMLARQFNSAAAVARVHRLLVLDSRYKFDSDLIDTQDSADATEIIDKSKNVANVENISRYVAGQLCVVGSASDVQNLALMVSAEKIVFISRNKETANRVGSTREHTPKCNVVTLGETESHWSAYVRDGGIRYVSYREFLDETPNPIPDLRLPT